MSTFHNTEYLSHLVDGITAFQIKDIGSNEWLECSQKMNLLAKSIKTDFEEIIQLLISRCKLPILVHELSCAQIWRIRVSPHLTDISLNAKSIFMVNIVTEYEHIIQLLLSLLLEDSKCLGALKNSTIDLVDYCVEGVKHGIGLINMGGHENYTEINGDESEPDLWVKNKLLLDFKMGFNCTTILIRIARYICSLPAIPTSVFHRLVITHDIPWLMADLLLLKPWQRLTKNGMEKCFDGQNWTEITNENKEKVTYYEMLAWEIMSNLLRHTTVQQYYSLNIERRNQFVLCTDLLNGPLIDQTPELIPLKAYLNNLELTNMAHNILKLEPVLPPEIREKLSKQAESGGGFHQIAKILELNYRKKDFKELILIEETIKKSVPEIQANEEEKASATVVKNCANK